MAMATDHLPTTEPQPRDYLALLKPRVMSLVVFTALVGMVVAPTPPHPVVGFAALLCIAIGAGASGALNMWWDADIDSVMSRTKNRPIPAGRVSADEAFGVGVGLSILSVLMLALFGNPVSAALLALTIAFYVVIYTMWLKRRTPQNIVIGGAAGAFPPMIGWAVATDGVSVESILMFLIIFLWTPPHFWALALFKNEDYQRVGVPMLPVVAGERETRKQILLYTLIMAPVALAPVVIADIGGPIYAVLSVMGTALFLGLAWRIYRRDQAQSQADQYRTEKQLFGFSILYLFGLFAALALDALMFGGTA